MHEVSLMMNIIDTVLEEATRADAVSVKTISLRIGEKSGVIVDSIKFAFSAVIKDTIADAARLEIEIVPFRGECLACGHQFNNDDYLICNRCGGPGKIISGQELTIQSIEVE